MKTVYFIIIILAAALAVMAWRMYGISHNAEPKADAASGATSVASARNTAIECIMTRSSVRSYTDRQVEKATVDTLLRAAMAAPTARDSRPWRFIVINERALLDTLAARCPNMSMAVKAPMAVVVCGDLEAADAKGGHEYWDQDCSAATENLLLAAHAMGLGAVWCGVYPQPDRVKTVSELLGIPGSVIPLCVVPMGYPAGAPNVKDKFDFHRIHYNYFQPQTK